MARFILDVASKAPKISHEELKKVIDIHKDYFGGFISTITLIDDTNENQFYDEELEDDPSLNDLNEDQINNFKKANREFLNDNPNQLNINKLKNNLNEAGLNVIVFD